MFVGDLVLRERILVNMVSDVAHYLHWRVVHACGSRGKGFHWVSNLKKHMTQWFVLIETAEGDFGELSI